MYYLNLLNLIGIITMFVGMIAYCILAAAACYSRGGKGATGEALPFEAGLAYVMWAGAVSVDHGLAELRGLGTPLLFLLSYLVAHVICVMVGRKWQQLQNYSWLD